MKKKSMSVREMGRMLGLGKTNSYWLVKKHYFKTILVAGKMRVLVDSFEEWYQKQEESAAIPEIPQIADGGQNGDTNNASGEDASDAALLMRLLQKPEMAQLLKTLAQSL